MISWIAHRRIDSNAQNEQLKSNPFFQKIDGLFLTQTELFQHILEFSTV